jgi:hypothetical protein
MNEARHSFYPWEDGVLLIAVDPASLCSAIAWRGKGKDGGVIRGVTSISDIIQIGKIDELLRSLDQVIDFDRVVLGVEYPRWNAGAAQTVRSAANTFIRLVKGIFPRKVQVSKIDPNEWQALFGFRSRAKGITTKDYSRWVSETAYRWEIGKDHDKADATLILEYLRTEARSKMLPKKRKTR